MPAGTLTLYQTIGYVYKISHKTNINLKFYIGSTDNLPERIIGHKCNCNNPNSVKYNFKVYKYIRAHGGWNMWTMKPILRSGKYEEIEALFIRRTWSKNVNSLIPGRKKKEYNKEWYQDNKAKMYKVCICEYCGKKYTKKHKARHESSIKCYQKQFSLHYHLRR